MDNRSDWKAIVFTFALGTAGAVQVGRVAPAASVLQQDLHLNLIAIGWLISLVTLATAVLGLAAGHWVVKNGLRTSLLAGALLLLGCVLVTALTASLPVLIGARILEGLGYLAIVVAAPTLIAREATAEDAPLALAIWGTFFPLGLGLASFAGGTLSEVLGWRAWFFASGGLVFLAGLAVLFFTPADRRACAPSVGLWQTITKMPAASWLLGAAFLGLTLLSLSILSLFPAFLVQAHGFTPSAAGRMTGTVALGSIFGSLSYGFLSKRLSDAMIASIASCVLIASAFPAFSTGSASGQIVVFAAIATFMSGILVAQTFATVPKVAGTPDLVGPSNGLVAQLGSLGALIGPPLVGALITITGWTAVPLIVAGFALSFFVLFLLLTRRHMART